MKFISKLFVIGMLAMGTLGVPAQLGSFPTKESAATPVAMRMTCQKIISYCYQMWIIRRRNYPQYVACVLSNAENNGLVCRP